MDKNLDIQVAEALRAYLASGVEDQVRFTFDKPAAHTPDDYRGNLMMAE